jgi:hypothetical protein
VCDGAFTFTPASTEALVVGPGEKNHFAASASSIRKMQYAQQMRNFSDACFGRYGDSGAATHTD